MGLLDTAVNLGSLGTIDSVGDLTGANQAADAMTQANQDSIAALTDMYNQSVELNQPFLDLGLRNLQTLEGEVGALTPEGRLQQIQDSFQTSPGFQNSLTLGRDTIEAGAAGGGNLFSGNTLKDLETFRTDLANREFGNYTNQFNQIEDSRLNRLAALGGVGQTAAGTITGLNQGQGENLSQTALNQGQIGASQAMAPFNTLLQVGGVAGSFY